MEIPIDMNIFQSPLLQTVVSMDAMIPEDVIDEILFPIDMLGMLNQKFGEKPTESTSPISIELLDE